MMKRQLEKGKLMHEVALAPYTYWQIGGNAEKLYNPLNLQDLQQFLKTLPLGEKLTWLGLGSNVLVPDEGLPGTVIITQGGLMGLELIAPDIIRAEAGVACAQVARFAARHNLVGGEFLAGIPGTVGGALNMNAGAFGGETWRSVHAVQTIDREGNVQERKPEEFKIAYREVHGLNGQWFVAGIFKFQAGDGKEGMEKIKSMLEKRAQTQPANEPSCGSTFRNPPGDFAGRLIETTGLKGLRHGNAQVSEKHANFIVNKGGATAADVAALIKEVRQKVYEKHGVWLQPEVHILSDALKP
jgi:UDP-N-acetylmuramate dehydrogenase